MFSFLVPTGSQPILVPIFYQNVRGLNRKTHKFFTNCCDMSFKLIALTETWLNDSVFNSELFPDCYNVIRRDRNFATTGRSRGGGVLVAIWLFLILSNIHLLILATFQI